MIVAKARLFRLRSRTIRHSMLVPSPFGAASVCSAAGSLSALAPKLM
jgi:hypothetical protein